MAEQTSDGAAAPTEATRRPRRRDLPVEGQLLLLVTLGLTAIGQVMVYSASSPVAMTTARYGNDPLYFVKNGVVFTIGGVLLMLLVMRTAGGAVQGPDAARARGLAGAAGGRDGARRGGDHQRRAAGGSPPGPITLQPSELAKFALLGTVAALLAAKKTAPQSFGELMKPIGLLTGLVCALVLAEPDLGLRDRDRDHGGRNADRRRRAGAAAGRDHGHRPRPRRHRDLARAVPPRAAVRVPQPRGARQRRLLPGAAGHHRLRLRRCRRRRPGRVDPEGLLRARGPHRHDLRHHRRGARAWPVRS